LLSCAEYWRTPRHSPTYNARKRSALRLPVPDFGLSSGRSAPHIYHHMEPCEFRHPCSPKTRVLPSGSWIYRGDLLGDDGRPECDPSGPARSIADGQGTGSSGRSLELPDNVGILPWRSAIRRLPAQSSDCPKYIDRSLELSNRPRFAEKSTIPEKAGAV
jgi:hypothetical protein